MADLRTRTCCFTGHRDIAEADKIMIETQAEAVIQELYNKGVCFFGVGGAIGFDTMMAELLFRLREESLPDIKVILVYPFDGFTNRWNEAHKELYTVLLPKYDKVVCVERHPSRYAFLTRDRHLVNHSAYCVAYCMRDTGGTAYTMKFAQKQGLIVYNLADPKIKFPQSGLK